MQERAADPKDIFRMSLLIDNHLVAECIATSIDDGIKVVTHIDAGDRFTEELIEVCENLSGAIVAMLAKIDDDTEETWVSVHCEAPDDMDDIPF